MDPRVRRTRSSSRTRKDDRFRRMCGISELKCAASSTLGLICEDGTLRPSIAEVRRGWEMAGGEWMKGDPYAARGADLAPCLSTGDVSRNSRCAVELPAVQCLRRVGTRPEAAIRRRRALLPMKGAVMCAELFAESRRGPVRDGRRRQRNVGWVGRRSCSEREGEH